VHPVEWVVLAGGGLVWLLALAGALLPGAEPAVRHQAGTP
jgi:hypothetical protein